MRAMPILTVCLGLWAAGCSHDQQAQRRSYDWSAAGRESYTSHSPEAVMAGSAAEAHQAAVVEGEANGYDQPIAGWWLTRNDARLNVRSGYRSPVVENFVVYTYDRQQSYGGRVYDTYYRNTYSTKYGQTIR